ncbi:hypothetical protein [Actinoplanes sp. URMC 104]
MSAEPLTTTPDTVAPVDSALAAEKGLLIAVLLLVLLGTSAMLFMA